MPAPTPSFDLQEHFAGLLLGTAVGDLPGLPAENLSAEKIRKRWNGEWKMRFIFGKGMVSDDTEHTLMVAQALLEDKTVRPNYNVLLLEIPLVVRRVTGWRWLGHGQILHQIVDGICSRKMCGCLGWQRPANA